jgi:small subunit ribosomal protein S6
MIPGRMPSDAATYDLVLMLDPAAEDAVRAKILADVRQAVSTQGELLRDDDWGDRALAYPIDHKTTAEYHLLQFHVKTPELLSGLERSLGITDGIIRFRIVKLKPGTPDAPDMGSARRSEAESVAEPAAVEPAAAVVEPAAVVVEPVAAAEPVAAEPAAAEPVAAEHAAATDPA